uniref:Uncharacterized protein n=1 Tax=viral metagenome TaxID=1070528 RepID=A0A6C0CVF2_9ZZZZ
MSCLGKNYNPFPTKEWYRFENQCVYNTQSLGSVLQNKKLAEEISVLNKGNILQYKKNSSNLTKKQVYAQIARGMWTNRTTSWATQSQTYTNPNTKSLKRVNYTEIIVNPVTASGNVITADGIICPATNLTPDLDATIVIPDGGSLICNITENQCTGQVYKVTQKNNCNPLSASDVPGPTTAALCYNSALPTYYPKVKRTYGTAGDKWPQGAKLIFPA